MRHHVTASRAAATSDHSASPSVRQTLGRNPARSADLTAVNELVQSVVAAPGQPLESEVRLRLGARLGHDFSRVRVHTDARAAESAELLGARAYTVGNHVVFGAGRYQPETAAGAKLIAHEAVHVLQQDESHDHAHGELILAPSGAHHDREAERITDASVSPDRERSSSSTRGAVAEPVAVTRAPRPSGTLIVQRALLGGLIGGGIGGVIGGLAGFAIGGPVGALVGAGVGIALGAAIGASISPFPTYAQITGNSDVQARVNGAWAATLAATTAVSRREEGFWIRLNKGTDKFEFTPTILGPVVGPAVGGSVVLGGRPADVNSGASDAIYTVASFHTHTPTSFRPVGRPVGPSGADNAADTSDDVVGLVYDYVASPPASGNIPAGHPLASVARLYHSGPNRRQRI